MRVADYLADFIRRRGVGDIFLVTGGGMMFLADALALNDRIQSISMHHEQAAAMAAVSYAKYTESLGVCYVSTGCGGTNAVTGLLAAWQDSIPALFVSGQCKTGETISGSGLPLRQFGVQEADILSIVRPLTKYAVTVFRPDLIAHYLEKAVFLARHGRPGPVWVDIPLDVQAACVDADHLPCFDSAESCPQTILVVTLDMARTVGDLLAYAKRPIILAGHGIRLAHCVGLFKDFLRTYCIPTVVSKLGVDLLPTSHPMLIGRAGTKGDRPGNFAIQNADVILCLGCRLSVSTTGYAYRDFARGAKLVVVDIDPIEHKKNTVAIDRFIHADVRDFLQNMMRLKPPPKRQSWLRRCCHWRRKYPVCLSRYADPAGRVNPYHFIDCLSSAMNDHTPVVCDAGSAFYVTTQGLRLGDGQRCIFTGAQAEMGYTLPAAIGVCYASEGRDVVGITGDGSLQMNIQEFQTIRHNSLPIKIFVWNNDGYLSIRATQRKFFSRRIIGTDSTSGISLPDLSRLAAAYGLPYSRVERQASLPGAVNEALASQGPAICELMCDREHTIAPVVPSIASEDGSIASRPLEDMAPLLSREELHREMIVGPVED